MHFVKEFLTIDQLTLGLMSIKWIKLPEINFSLDFFWQIWIILKIEVPRGSLKQQSIACRSPFWCIFGQKSRGGGQWYEIFFEGAFLFVCFKGGMGNGACPGPPFAWRTCPYLQKNPQSREFPLHHYSGLETRTGGAFLFWCLCIFSSLFNFQTNVVKWLDLMLTSNKVEWKLDFFFLLQHWNINFRIRNGWENNLFFPYYWMSTINTTRNQAMRAWF